MFRRSAQKRRSTNHDHAYAVNNVGADLQRKVCTICGQVSIVALPPVDVRSTLADVTSSLFGESPLTIVIDEAVQPAGLSWQFADRQARR